MAHLVVTEKVNGGKQLVEAELNVTQYATSTALPSTPVEAKRKPLYEFKVMKVFISAYSNVENKTRVKEYTLTNNNVELSTISRGFTGDPISINADFQIDGTDLVIEITNNEVYNLSIVITTILIA